MLVNWKMLKSTKIKNSDYQHSLLRREWTQRNRQRIQMSSSPFNHTRRCQLFQTRTTSDWTVFLHRMLANRVPIQSFSRLRTMFVSSYHLCITNQKPNPSLYQINKKNDINTEITAIPPNQIKMMTKNAKPLHSQKMDHDIERESPAQTPPKQSL